MKKIILGVFSTRESAEEAIHALHHDLGISTNEISYVYRNMDDEVREVEADEISSGTPAEGAKTGAMTGGAVGAIAGIATVVGLIPVVGPIFAAGPIVTALGLGGAVGTTAAAAATGAAVGGLIGALVNLGVPETRAKEYEDRVHAGDILVMVHTSDDEAVSQKLRDSGAMSVDSYEPTV
ncbi:MAG: DUF1269 domain-containing protein [Candidatus Paceibacterota bacterium]